MPKNPLAKVNWEIENLKFIIFMVEESKILEYITTLTLQRVIMDRVYRCSQKKLNPLSFYGHTFTLAIMVI